MSLLATLSAIALTSTEFVRGEERTPTKHASRPDLVTQGGNATFANYSAGGAGVATDFASGLTGAYIRHGITDHAILQRRCCGWYRQTRIDLVFQPLAIARNGSEVKGQMLRLEQIIAH